jgi:peptidoglycan/LPS O-acetylase OafA/YrhL
MSNVDYRPDIDGLRALAVASVIGFHFFPEIFHSGFIGVDIFFIISGFLITRVIANNIADSKFGIIDFYYRRIRRIFPALLMVIIASIFFGWFTLTAEEYGALGKHTLAGVGFFSNFLLWSESSYFDVAAEKKIFLHLWSLGIEEQFYIAWPFLLYMLFKIRINPIFTTLAILLGSFFFNISIANKNELAELFYSPLTRAWELLIGSVMALIILNRECIPSIGSNYLTVVKTNYLSCCGLLLVIISLFLIDKEYKYPGVWAVFPTTGATLLIYSSPDAWINKTLLSNRILVWLGLISYPLYLWHWPLLAFANIIQGKESNIFVKVLMIIASIFMAWITYLYIEKPIRFSRKKNVIAILVSCGVLVGLVGGWIHKSEGVLSRSAANPISQLEGDIGREAYLDYIVKMLPACADKRLRELSSNDQKYGYRCFQSVANERVSVLIVGDSHAEHLLPGLAKQFKTLNIGSFVQPGLPVQSNSLFSEAFELIKNDEDIKTVILSAFWMEKIPDASDQMKEDLVATLRMLVGANKNIVLMDDVPNFLFDPSRCKYQRIFRFDKTQCSIPVDLHEKNKGTYSEVISFSVEKIPEIHYIDLTDIFCNEETCSMQSGGHLLYRDMHHLNMNGSFFVGERVSVKLANFIRKVQ